MEITATMLSRVRERVTDIGRGPTTLAREAGLDRGYIRDILTGRKKAIRYEMLPQLASALRCDPRYLTGEIDDPLTGESQAQGGDPSHRFMAVDGVCETGAWQRHATAALFAKTIPVLPDQRFDARLQRCFEVRGDNLARWGIVNGMYAIAVEPSEYKRARGDVLSGAIAIVKRERVSLGEVEISGRVIRDNAGTITLPASVDDAGRDLASIPLTSDDADERISIIGIVTIAVSLIS